MDPLTMLTLGSAGLSLINSAKAAKTAKAIGRMRNQSAKQHALQVTAMGQRAALEQMRQAEVLASRAVAVAAAGGGNPDDPSISKIITDINGEGAYRAAIAMYEAETEADQLRYEGRLAEAAGKQEAANEYGRMVGAGLGAAADIYTMDKFGMLESKPKGYQRKVFTKVKPNTALKAREFKGLYGTIDYG